MCLSKPVPVRQRVKLATGSYVVCISGHGKLVFLDGSYYEGMFNMGEIDGFGFRFFAATGCKYQGQFVRGELHGKGRMIWPDGSIYEGQWDHNRRQGIFLTLYTIGYF